MVKDKQLQKMHINYFKYLYLYEVVKTRELFLESFYVSEEEWLEKSNTIKDNISAIESNITILGMHFNFILDLNSQDNVKLLNNILTHFNYLKDLNKSYEINQFNYNKWLNEYKLT